MAKVETHDLFAPSPAAFAVTDTIAIRTGDICALFGRVLLGWIFLTSGSGKVTNVPGFVSYLTNLRLPAPGFWGWVGAIVELVVGVTLVFGVAARYGALLGFIFVVVATAIAHRYWELPPAQQLGQYINFMKNIAIMGGMLLLFFTGAGRFSVDGWLRRKR
ncbi:MAG TPA: DoxX family protein [Xanthobacteraceae bacterium]|nr:DoxX family protein [Xanthobacteraceae bacterium]